MSDVLLFHTSVIKSSTNSVGLVSQHQLGTLDRGITSASYSIGEVTLADQTTPYLWGNMGHVQLESVPNATTGEVLPFQVKLGSSGQTVTCSRFAYSGSAIDIYLGNSSTSTDVVVKYVSAIGVVLS